jgi:hypothetical protein
MRPWLCSACEERYRVPDEALCVFCLATLRARSVCARVGACSWPGAVDDSGASAWCGTRASSRARCCECVS